MKVSLYNQQAQNVGEIELNEKIYSVKPSLHLLAEAVRVQDSNARKGLANTKNRGEVSGGGKKPWRQKGTGRARAGSNRSPIWRGGGITFGPTSDRNWTLKINKKAKTKALFMSLTDKVQANQMIIVDKIELPESKTKEFVQVITSFSTQLDNLGKKLMLVLPSNQKTLVAAARNIPFVNVVLASSLNVKDVLIADTMIVVQDSLEVIEKTYLRETASKSAVVATPVTA
ncbi:MAG: 50S ribosomal protein L4 [Candidatus Doudnabacteria bacterium]